MPPSATVGTAAPPVLQDPQLTEEPPDLEGFCRKFGLGPRKHKSLRQLSPAVQKRVIETYTGMGWLNCLRRSAFDVAKETEPDGPLPELEKLREKFPMNDEVWELLREAGQTAQKVVQFHMENPRSVRSQYSDEEGDDVDVDSDDEDDRPLGDHSDEIAEMLSKMDVRGPAVLQKIWLADRRKWRDTRMQARREILETATEEEKLRMKHSTLRMKRSMRPQELLEHIHKMRKLGLLDNYKDASKALTDMALRKRGGFSDEAVAVLEQMREQTLSPKVKDFNMAMLTASRDHEWEMALNLHDQIKQSGLKRNEQSFSYLIGALGHGGEWERALKVLGGMKQEGVAPNLITYTQAIKALEVGGQWRAAMEVLTDVYQDQLVPDVQLWTSTIGACGRGGQLQLVYECLDQMWQSEVDPNLITYNSVMRACYEAGDYVRATRLLEAMKEDDILPNEASYNLAIRACVKNKQWESALDLYSRMKQDAGAQANMYTYMELATSLEEAERYAFAMRMLTAARKLGLNEDVVEGMREKGNVPPKSAYLAAFLNCEDEGKWQTVLELLGQMKGYRMSSGKMVHRFLQDMSRTFASVAVSKQIRKALNDLDDGAPPAEEWQRDVFDEEGVDELQPDDMRFENAPLWARNQFE